MKIGIDTFACDSGSSGVGAYITQIIKRIPPSGARYELFGWDFDRFAFGDAPGALEFIPRCSINGRAANTLWHIARYPKFARSRSYDGCFFPAAHRQLPLRSPCPAIGTVHDMAAFWRGGSLQGCLAAVLPNALRSLDRIIAVSHFVKQELVERAAVKEARIEVVPNGVDHGAFYPRPRKNLVMREPFSFRRPYILCVSRIDHPIKNHVRLIAAFGVFKERTRCPHRLVLAGAEGRWAGQVRAAVAASAYRGDIFFTGHFPVQSLPELYAGSDFTVIPSLYEGFGQGVLEAMASGVPVACARAASLPETAGHAALYFDPLDVEDMADRMVHLTGDRSVYRDCRTKGLEQARSYSWDRCAERTLSIIQETVGH